MEASSVQKYICRICLQYSPNAVDIFTDDFPKMIEILTSLKITNDDQLPQQSCIKCAIDVKNAILVRRRILKSNKILCEQLTEQILNRNINKVEENVKNEEDNIIIEPIQIKDIPNESLPQNNTIKPSQDNAVKRIREKVKKNKPVVPRTCEKCNIQLPNSYRYKLHMSIHKNSKCHICGKTIRTQHFKKHVRDHEDTTPAKCDICGVVYRNASCLRYHIVKNHKVTGNRFVCEECGHGFKQRCHLNVHKMRRHGGERKFKCETCGMSFHERKGLKKHVDMTHKRLRPYICEYCGKSFCSRNTLQTHARQHTKETPYKCKSCGEAFRQKVSLRTHLKRMHFIEEERNHICKMCTRGFITEEALTVHVQSHLWMKCPYCSSRFVQKSYMDSHIEEVHKDIIEAVTEENE